MTTGSEEEIRIGQLAIRFLVEGGVSGGSVAIFEMDVRGRRCELFGNAGK